jgi:hypothetical protein
MSWDELSKSGLPHGTTAVVNVAGQNVLDPLSSWTPKFQQLVREQIKLLLISQVVYLSLLLLGVFMEARDLPSNEYGVSLLGHTYYRAVLGSIS